MGKTITAGSPGVVLTPANYATYNPLSITTTGSVGNASGSAIYSDYAEPWIVNNAGTITSAQSGSTYGAVFLKAGGSVTNVTGGQISGVNYGVYIAASIGSPANVTNAGSISGTGGAGFGVFLPGGGTVTNAGTITGAGGTAVSLGTAASRVIFDGGAVFNGTVAANASFSNTLELASIGSGGTVTDLSGQFPGFSNIAIDAKATWHWQVPYGSGSGVQDTLTNGMSLTNAGTLLGIVNIQTGASVTNMAGAKISLSTYGSNVLMSGGTLINNGTISNPNNKSGVSGIYGKYDGYVSNGSTGTITVFDDGVRFHRGGTLMNSGLISATGAEAVYSYEHVTVTNNGTFLDSGKSGIAMNERYNGTFTNNSLISATGSKGIGLALSGDQYVASATNNGTISATGLMSTAVSNQGVLINGTAGTITGVRFGVSNYHYTGVNPSPDATLVNYGKITATSTITTSSSISIGVYTKAGDEVTNAAGGVITAIATGLKGVTATVINAGTIQGSGTAGLGVELSGGTLTTSGTIIGAGGTAVALDGKASNLLVVQPGALFLNGKAAAGIVKGVSGTSTIELASAISAGTIDGFGTQFVNIARVNVDSGASWTMTGTNTLASTSTLTNAGTLTLSAATMADAGAIVNNGSILVDPSTLTTQNLTGTGAVSIGMGSTFGVTGTASAGETIAFAGTTGVLQITPGNFSATIDGFFNGDTISLTGVLDATAASIVNKNTIEVTRGTHAAVDLTLDPARDLTGTTPTVAESGGNAIVTTNDVACFAAGTHIETPDGPVPVERLREGDLVCMAVGGVRPVRWIGFREVDLRRHPSPERARPVRVKAGAFRDGVPCRDLRLSPDHAVLIRRMLIPIRLLVNGASIVFETNCRSVTYHHVELDCHDILLAEKVPAESYLDTGNRAMFANADLPMRLHPDFGEGQERREANSCAAIETDPVRVKTIWDIVAARSAWIGLPLPLTAPTTRDPALRIVIGKRVVEPVIQPDGCHVFTLPRGAGAVRLVSRSDVPSRSRPWVEDRRVLGVMVARLTLHMGDDVRAIPLDDLQTRDGWWDLERNDRTAWRWTNGDARLAMPRKSPVILEVVVAGTLDYPDETTTAELTRLSA